MSAPAAVATDDPAARSDPARPPARPWRRRLLDRVPRAYPATALVATCIAAILYAAASPGLVGDVWFHLAAGRWMLAHHALLRRNVFSYTVPNRPWFDDEWGFDLGLAWLDQTIGPLSFWLLSGGACAVALVCAVLHWRRLGARSLRVGLLALLATASMIYWVTPRPQDPSYAFFAWLLCCLELARTKTRWLASLPVLFVIWANVHGSFLLGLVVLALELAWSLSAPYASRIPRRLARRRLPTRPLLASLCASTAATLVNPHGPMLWSFALRLSLSGRLSSIITEWMPPDLHSLFFLGVICGPVVLLVLLALLTPRSFDPVLIVLVLGLYLSTLHSERFMPYLGLACCATLASLGPAISERTRPARAWTLAAMLLVPSFLLAPRLPPGAITRSGPGAVPARAVAYLAHHRGRVLSTDVYSDYLLYRHIPDFVDGRTDLFLGTGLLSDYLSLADLTRPPDPLLARYDVAYVLWPRHTPLATYLAADPRWKVVLVTKAAVLFARVHRPRPARLADGAAGPADTTGGVGKAPGPSRRSK